MEGCVIEKGIPVPERLLTRGRYRWAELLKMMKPGDSIVLTKHAAKRFQERVWKLSGLSVVTQKVSHAEVRCWLVENKGPGGKFKKKK